MRTRRVMLHLEVESDAPLSILRNSSSYEPIDFIAYEATVLQAQANVIAAKKDTKSRKG